MAEGAVGTELAVPDAETVRRTAYRPELDGLRALAVYLVLQGLRFWVMFTLGKRWTTRIIVLPGEPLVSTGPYRYLAHPNYAVVAGEIATLPLVLGLPWLAVLFSGLNAVILFIRIRAENRALEPSRSHTARAAP